MCGARYTCLCRVRHLRSKLLIDACCETYQGFVGTLLFVGCGNYCSSVSFMVLVFVECGATGVHYIGPYSGTFH